MRLKLEPPEYDAGVLEPVPTSISKYQLQLKLQGKQGPSLPPTTHTASYVNVNLFDNINSRCKNGIQKFSCTK